MKGASAVCLILACVKLVSGQCDGPSITIASTADASSISSCETYNGNVAIDPSASGAIALDGIRIITGDLIASNASQLTSLTASNLAQISGSFELNTLDALSTVDFPALTSVGRVQWLSLPGLQEFSNQVGISQADVVSVSNTALQRFSGFTLTASNTVDINNNRYLETVVMNDLRNVTSSLSVQANAPNINIVLGSLEAAGNLTFRNISGLSLPALADIGGSLACYSCAVATLRFNNIVTTGGSLTFVSTDLQSLEFPRLVSIGGGLQLSNNTYLQQIDGFSNLATIEGSVQLNGDFEGVNFSNLSDVQGTVIVGTSSSNNSICEDFEQARSSGIITGELQCQTSVTGDQANGTTVLVPTITASSGGDSGSFQGENRPNLPGGAIAGIVVAAIALLATGAGALYFFRRRNNLQRLESKDGLNGTEPLPGYAQLPAGRGNEKVELYVDPRAVTELNGVNGHAKSVPGLYEMGDTSRRSRSLGEATAVASDDGDAVKSWSKGDDTAVG